MTTYIRLATILVGGVLVSGLAAAQASSTDATQTVKPAEQKMIQWGTPSNVQPASHAPVALSAQSVVPSQNAVKVAPTSSINTRSNDLSRTAVKPSANMTTPPLVAANSSGDCPPGRFAVVEPSHKVMCANTPPPNPCPPGDINAGELNGTVNCVYSPPNPLYNPPFGN
jgi:hypothetical protein